jgi:hypothetical protein
MLEGDVRRLEAQIEAGVAAKCKDQPLPDEIDIPGWLRAAV